MKKMYNVVIHCEGAVNFTVEADNMEQAEQLAWERFDDMDDKELVASFCDFETDDIYEV